MDLIKPPPLRNSMVRRGKTTDADVISELGIYGIFVRYIFASLIPFILTIYF